MVELGKFRAIAQEDLAEFAYGGDKGRMRPDIENLMHQGLVEIKSIPHEEMGSRKLLTLTKNGHRFLTATQSAGKGQVLYHGFTKPRETNHDADLYRLYQKASEKIEEQGGRNLRVVLDYEMKKRLYHDLAKLGPWQAFFRAKTSRCRTAWASGCSRKDSSSRHSDRIRSTRRRKGSCGPRTRHQSLPGKKSGGKSPRWILHLRPRRRCFETPARIGSARIDR